MFPLLVVFSLIDCVTAALALITGNPPMGLAARLITGGLCLLGLVGVPFFGLGTAVVWHNAREYRRYNPADRPTGS
jgi:hypothetical protein